MTTSDLDLFPSFLSSLHFTFFIMAGKRTTKRSSVASKGQNTTLDQYFAIKKKKPNENSQNTTINTDENFHANDDFDIKTKDKVGLVALGDTKGKQQQRIPTKQENGKQLPLQDRTTHNRKRQPLSVISDTPHCLNMQTTDKPRLPTFVVLRDEEIDQGVTEADQRTNRSTIAPPDNNDLLTTKQTQSTQPTQQTQESSPTQSVPVVDTQASILTCMSSPVALVSSQDSFFEDEDGGIEFRVDALEDDETEDENDDEAAAISFFDQDDEYKNDYNNESAPISDEESSMFLTKTYRRSYRRPPAATSATSSPPHSSYHKDDKGDKDDGENSAESKITTTSHQGQTDETSPPTLEFSISNSLVIPLEIKANYESDNETTDEERTAASTQPGLSPIPSRQVSHISSSSSPSSVRSSDQPTLPMSLSFDDSTEIHVAYPFPRGKDITDKFGS
jgi:hypothetical protein